VRAGRLQMHGWVYDLYSLRLCVYDKTAGGFCPAEEVLGGTGPTGG
jgi:carbonic anhydrase